METTTPAAAPHTPRSLRALRGLTQVELAAKAGVSDRVVRNLEDGDDATLDSLRSIAAALAVTLETLIAAHEVERRRRAGKVA